MLPSKKIKNITGQKFNNLTVIEFDKTNHNGASVWKCRCDCGKIISVTSNHLQRGQTKSCGCLTAVKSYEQAFKDKGLMPLEEITGTKTKVSCVDKDGYKYSLTYDNVMDKRTKSFNRWSKLNPYKAENMRLFASSVQENCIILSSDEELRNATTQRLRFVCPVCGEEFTKKWCHWIEMPKNCHVCPKCNDNPISAGISQYTRLTNDWLKEHNIKFIREKTFPDLVDERPLRFDFCIENQDGLILLEVDGPQHDRPFGWTNEEYFAKLNKHDKMKDEYCANRNDITLVRLHWKSFRGEYIDILNKTFFGLN